MSRIADDMIDGECCALCGQYFFNSFGEIYQHGFQVACNDCYETDCGYEKQSDEVSTDPEPMKPKNRYLE